MHLYASPSWVVIITLMMIGRHAPIRVGLHLVTVSRPNTIALPLQKQTSFVTSFVNYTNHLSKLQLSIVITLVLYIFNNSVQHQWTKQIDIDIHFLRYKIAIGHVLLLRSLIISICEHIHQMTPLISISWFLIQAKYSA